MNDTRGKWLASDYMDTGAYGVLDYDNHIIVRSRHGLSKEECTDIAAAHNATLAQALTEELEAVAQMFSSELGLSLLHENHHLRVEIQRMIRARKP